MRGAEPVICTAGAKANSVLDWDVIAINTALLPRRILLKASNRGDI